MPGDSGTALPNKAICCERGLHAPGAAGGGAEEAVGCAGEPWG